MIKNYIIIFVFSILISCQTSIDKVIKKSKENGEELEKVLSFFTNDSCNKKLVAAEFLIENMLGNYAIDTSYLYQYRPFLKKISKMNLNEDVNKKEIQLLWETYKKKYKKDTLFYTKSYDCEKITASYLIKDINLAYFIWDQNKYNKDNNFENFLEYVLPYRRKNGLPIENWRIKFYKKNQKKISNYTDLSLLQVCDKLLYQLKDFKHNQFLIVDYPLLKVEDFELIKRGLCDHKCWYNSMFFASLGIPCTIDFVPYWGNKNSAHSWNAIIDKESVYPFEPFWDKDRWKYKYIYNNESWDDEWGKFRLPKVYRNTYSSNFDGPICDSRVSICDIPDLFKNVKKKDVSNEYFKTININLSLTKSIPEKTYYAYICVFGNNQWHPVQWGKINKNQVVFKGMGKDILYLCCFYKKGKLIKADDPFYLSQEGKIIKFASENNITEDLFVNRLTYLNPKNCESIKKLKGSYFMISKNQDFCSKQIIYTIPDSSLACTNLISLNKSYEGRFVRLMVPKINKFELAEIKFYKLNLKNKLEEISCNVSVADKRKVPEVKKIIDGLTVTSIEINNCRSDNNWIEFDLGKNMRIDAISYCPKIESQINKQSNYELCYWDKGWKYFEGEKEKNNNFIFFKNVPKNVLLKLENTSDPDEILERIFIYKNGEQKWF